MDALCLEIENFAKMSAKKEVETIYFGGGTPSTLTVDQFNQIFKTIRENFNIDEEAEITVEVNPESVSLDKVLSYKENGVNRISIGLQTTDDKLLREIGRLHSYVQFMNVYNMFRNEGFDNISLDIISNLIGQDLASYESTLKKVIELRPEHISSYSLSIEEGSIYGSLLRRGKLNYDDSLDRQMYDMTREMLKSAGYEHYEISNYCLDKKVSRHNLKYWELGEYKGLGIAAASYINGKRYKNIEKIRDYIAAQGDFEKINILEYEVDNKAYLEEFLFLGLRKLDGISVQKLNDILFTIKEDGEDYLEQVFDKLEKQVEKGYLKKQSDMFKLTKEGIDFSNQCFSELLLD